MKLFFPLKVVANALLAGISISLGTYVCLQVQGLAGAIFYSIGLMAVAHYQLLLYTTSVHKASSVTECFYLFLILLLNQIGCWLSSLMIDDPEIIATCKEITDQRAHLGFAGAVVQGLGCGFIITMGAQTWRRNKWILLIGTPAFILAGFNHAISDVFVYYVGGNAGSLWHALTAYAGTLAGNFIGGSIYKLGTVEKKIK